MSHGPGPAAAPEGQQPEPGGGGAEVPGPLRLHAVCRGHSRAVSRVRFSPDGQLLASVSADATVRLWRVADGAAAGPGSNEPEAAAADGADGDAPAPSGGGAAPAPAAGAQQQQAALMRHGAGINDVDWNPSGSYVATASDDLSARIWDAETGACLSRLEGHTNYVFCCQFDPAGHILATGSFDETIRFWDVRSSRCLRELPAHSDPITALDFTHDGTVLASCSFDGLLRLWDTHNGHCLKTLAIDNGSNPLSHVCFSPNGRFMLLASLDSKLRLVGFETGKVAKTYSGHSNTKFSSISAFAPALLPQPCVAAGSEDGGLFVWDVNSKQVVQRIPGRPGGDDPGPGHCGAVLCVAAHPTQPMLASAGHEPDCTVRLWSAAAADAAADVPAQANGGDVAMAEAAAG